jgi:hypothetical protein
MTTLLIRTGSAAFSRSLWRERREIFQVNVPSRGPEVPVAPPPVETSPTTPVVSPDSPDAAALDTRVAAVDQARNVSDAEEASRADVTNALLRIDSHESFAEDLAPMQPAPTSTSDVAPETEVAAIPPRLESILNAANVNEGDRQQVVALLDGMGEPMQQAMIALMEGQPEQLENVLRLGNQLKDIAPQRMAEICLLAADPRRLQAARDNPALAGDVKFVDGLDSAQKEMLHFMAKKMNESGEGNSVFERITSSLTKEIDPEVSKEMEDKANKALEGVDISQLSPADIALKKAIVMASHGVSVVEEGNTLKAKAPATQLEKFINHGVGFIMVFTAIGEKVKETKAGAKGKEQEESAASAENDAVAPDRQDAEATRADVRNRVLDAVATDLNSKNTWERHKSNAENVLPSVTTVVRDAQKKVADLEAELSMKQTQLQAETDAARRGVLTAEISAVSTRLTNARTSAANSQRNLDAMQKQRNESTENLQMLSSLEEQKATLNSQISRGKAALDAAVAIINDENSPISKLASAMSGVKADLGPKLALAEGVDATTFLNQLAVVAGVTMSDTSLNLDANGYLANPSGFTDKLDQAVQLAQAEAAKKQAP